MDFNDDEHLDVCQNIEAGLLGNVSRRVRMSVAPRLL